MWVNLNVPLLQEGIDGFIKGLRKLPKEVRSLPVGFFLESKMKEFKDSIPLLLDLKNDALRERYFTIFSFQLACSFFYRSGKCATNQRLSLSNVTIAEYSCSDTSSLLREIYNF